MRVSCAGSGCSRRRPRSGRVRGKAASSSSSPSAPRLLRQTHVALARAVGANLSASAVLALSKHSCAGEQVGGVGAHS